MHSSPLHAPSRRVHGGRKCQQSCRIRVHAALATAPATSTADVALPPSLRNNVVVLDAPNPDVPGGVTKVYLLGMSHVSKVSVDQVKELVRTVRPDVVGVELCRDRLPLLADSSKDVITNLVWHCRHVEVEGLPDTPEWPAWDSLHPLLRSQPGQPLTTQDIEADVLTLLSTGLFRSAAPQCRNADVREAPAFLVSPTTSTASISGGAADSVEVQTVPPLGCIKFVVAPRALPPIQEMTVRLDSSLKAVENPEAQLATLCADTMACTAVNAPDGQVPALTALLRARQSVAALFATPVVVSFLGVETGKVEMLVRVARDSDPPFLSGFEDSAQGGSGWGIDVFRPKKNLFKISDKLFLPQEYLDGLRAQARGLGRGPSSQDGDHTNGTGPAPAPPAPRSVWRPWTRQEMESCDPPMFEGGAWTDTLNALVTGLYAKDQARAARKLGVTAGAAWQAALQAASEVGAQQVVLIDRPTVVTERRLADSLVKNTGVRMGMAAGLVLSTFVAALVSDVLSPAVEVAGFSAVCGAAYGLLWPLVGPLREIAALADMTPEQIEEAVRVKQPIASGDLSQPLKLFGEDALLDWPGAMGPIIRDRDTYMARALAGVATGAAEFSPTFVRQERGGQQVWQYMMPEGAPTAAAPAGAGDGEVKPLAGVRTVVGVVGSAHVPGMVREWQAALQAPRDVDSLLTAEPSASSS